MLSSPWTASFACPSGSHRGPSRLSSVSSAVSPVWPSGSQSLRSQFTSGPTSLLSCSPIVVSLTLPRGSLGGPGRPDLARGYTVTCVLPEPTPFTTITLDGCTDFSPPGTAVACLSCQVLSANLALVTQTGRGLGVGLGGLRVLGSHGGGGRGGSARRVRALVPAERGPWQWGRTRLSPMWLVPQPLACGLERPQTPRGVSRCCQWARSLPVAWRRVPEDPCLLSLPHRGHRKDLGPRQGLQGAAALGLISLLLFWSHRCLGQGGPRADDEDWLLILGDH